MFQSIQPAHTMVSTSLHTLSKKWEYSHACTIKTRQRSFTWQGASDRTHVVWKVVITGKKDAVFLLHLHRIGAPDSKVHHPSAGLSGSHHALMLWSNTIKTKSTPGSSQRATTMLLNIPYSTILICLKRHLAVKEVLNTPQNRNWFNLSKVNTSKKEAKAGWSLGLWKKNIPKNKY